MINHRLQRFFKPRFAIVYPFAFFVLFFCSINHDSLKAGIGWIVTGLLIRLWSNGYAIKNDKLTTSGPYAFVRNPLYLGTFLIAIGFVITLRSSPALIEEIIGTIFLLALALIYRRTITTEEGMLTAKFNENYTHYCQNVPAMIPSLIPYTKGEKWPFNLQRLLFSKEHKNVLWIFILLVIFHLKTRLFIEHQELSQKSWYLIIIAAVFIAIDIAFEINKKKLPPKPSV